MQKQLVLLIGLPGVGKSSWAERHPAYTTISRDEIVNNLAVSLNKTYDQLVLDKQVDKLWRESINTQLSSTDEVVVIDAMNLTASGRSKLVKLGQKFGRVSRAVVFSTPDIKRLFSVVSQRSERLGGDKNISIALLHRFKSLFQEPTLEEGLLSIERVEVSHV